MRRNKDEFIAERAEYIRKALGIPLDVSLDVSALVSKYESAKDPNTQIKFVEVAKGYLGSAKARSEPKHRVVYYQQGLRKLLELGSRLAASIFLEEIGHITLKHDAPVMDHAIGTNIRFNARPELKDLEDEAEHFCWYMKAPISEVYGVKSPNVLIEKYLMSTEEAQKYHQHICETRDRIEGRTKPALRLVIDLQAERDKRRPVLRPPVPSHDDTPPEEPRSQKSQYSGFSHIPCKNCGLMQVVIRSGCEYCSNCGDEEGCS